MRQLIYYFTFLCLVVNISNAQIARLEPIFPKQNLPVTVIFDAKALSHTGMLGVNKVYMHSSIGTDSNQFVWSNGFTVGNWGMDDGVGEMFPLLNDEWSITFIPDNYYNIPNGVEAYNLAMVFRNEDGTVEGKSPDGSDIFIPLFGDGLLAKFVTPISSPTFGDVNDVISIYAAASEVSTMTLFENGSQLLQVIDDSIGLSYTITQTGKTWIRLDVDNGSEFVTDSIAIVVTGPLLVQDPPAGVQSGVNYINDSTVILALYAPEKTFAYVLGDFNDWQIEPDYYMHVSTDSNLYWLEISGLEYQKEYIYQYLVDGVLKIADPYTEKVSDPWNDQYITDEVYPNLIEYPFSKTNGIASVFQIGEPEYVWMNNASYVRPAKDELMVYELLIRDFLAAHDYKTLIDTLDYLETLGITAIELMPINEFEGNESWGYNPSFYFAVDKYYGPKSELKRFVDECHGRGIAVIVDVVLNHSFGQNPMVQLYWDPINNRPAANSPWFNEAPTHAFNVGYDFNHESPSTKNFVDDVNTFWIEEFNVDGFRFDLSKGFTQTFTDPNVGAWGNYDASRIALLKRMADVIWDVDSNFHVILEHFSDNTEEKELAEYGMMVWGNGNHNAAEAAMGYVNSSDFGWNADYKRRGWTVPHVVGYPESHDEERIMYKNLTFGNGNSNYSTKSELIALRRIEALASIFYTVPGPKMMWQFGEQGYDISIDVPCRVCNKPILWDYLQELNRYRLYKVYAAILNLRKNEEVFKTTDYSTTLGGAVKRVKLNHATMNVVAAANFSIDAKDQGDVFTHTGTWYDYLTGDSIEVTDIAADVHFIPGEYHIYTDVKLATPEIPYAPVGIDEIILNEKPSLMVFPNPVSATCRIGIYLDKPSPIDVKIYDLLGKEVKSFSMKKQDAGFQQLLWDGTNQSGNKLPNGNYIIQLTTGNHQVSAKVMLQK